MLTPYAQQLVERLLFLSEPVFLALHSTADGMTLTELTAAGGYARQPIFFGEDRANQALVSFGPAQADWPEVLYSSIWDATQNGMMLSVAPLHEPIKATAGDRINFQPGSVNLIYSQTGG